MAIDGVSRFNVPGDLMHTGALGVLQWFLGAVLWEMVFDGVWYGPIESRISHVWGADPLGARRPANEHTPHAVASVNVLPWKGPIYVLHR